MNPVNKKLLVLILGMLVAGLVSGYFYGHRVGYKKAEADTQKVQAEAAKKATDEAVKAANPFQAVNPLAGVEANPFEKAKNILNPFK